jgi:hypothetical protein
MNLTNRIATAALAGVVSLTGLAAAPAAARTSVSIEYRDRDYRDRDYRDYRDYRRDDRRYWHDRRYWRDNDRRYYDRQRCWTEYRWDGYRHERYAVRYCR